MNWARRATRSDRRWSPGVKTTRAAIDAVYQHWLNYDGIDNPCVIALTDPHGAALWTEPSTGGCPTDLSSRLALQAAFTSPQASIADDVTAEPTGHGRLWLTVPVSASPTPLPLPPTATTAPVVATTAPNPNEVSGAQLFQLACSSCHGADAGGSSFVKDSQKIEPPSIGWADLTKMYTTKPDRGTPEQQAVVGIVKGQDETGADLNAMMPRWTSLSQAQVDSLVAYIKATFK